MEVQEFVADGAVLPSETDGGPDQRQHVGQPDDLGHILEVGGPKEPNGGSPRSGRHRSGSQKREGCEIWLLLLNEVECAWENNYFQLFKKNYKKMHQIYRDTPK